MHERSTLQSLRQSPLMNCRQLLPALILSVFLTACGEKSESESQPEAVETTVSATAKGEAPQVVDQQSQIMGAMINQAAKAQAQGLDGGRLKVNGAWTYNGFSTLTPIESPPFPVRFVAVDVTVEGQTSNFDYDDIEIVDGADLTSFGSDPHITFLTLDGEVMPTNERPSAPPRPVRALLIYGFPVDSETFTLYYWGKKLVAPQTIAESGWALPYPAKTEPK